MSVKAKRIMISSLTMRFHEHDGWSLDLLEKYLVKGKLHTFTHDPQPYWILTPRSRLDIERLVADGHVGKLACRDQWGELDGMTDLEVLKHRSW